MGAVSERPFPKRDVREAMAARLKEAAPEMSEEQRTAAVRGFDEDLAAIIKHWQELPDGVGYSAFERAADGLDPPD
jgi:hypothetical protein